MVSVSTNYFLSSYDLCFLFFFFFSSRRRHTRFDCDWSSDVCSSDLVENRMKGETYGVELVAHWTPLDSWKLTASYSYLQMQLHLDPGSGDPFSEGAEGRSPHHQAQVHSRLDLTRNLQFDTAVYYVDNLPSLRVPGYIRLDVRLGWRPNRN